MHLAKMTKDERMTELIKRIFGDDIFGREITQEIKIPSYTFTYKTAGPDKGYEDRLLDVLGSLTKREAKVLRMRFGIDTEKGHTLEEVGKQFDATRERIRQIEAKALRKLRHPSKHLKILFKERK